MGQFSGVGEKRQRSRELKGSYKKWKKEGLTSYGFFPVFNAFKHSHLADMSGGALKLYLYLGLHARNSTGESWPGEERLANYFRKAANYSIVAP